jgi:hypothetical protein
LFVECVIRRIAFMEQGLDRVQRQGAQQEPAAKPLVDGCRAEEFDCAWKTSRE